MIDYGSILTKDFLIENYINKKLSMRKIAQAIPCDCAIVRYHLLKNKIPTRSKSESCIGRKFSQESKQKMSNSARGKSKSKEHRRKMSEAHLGKKRAPRSDEWRKKILSSICASPNKFELLCLKHLNKLYPGKFKYVGDGSIFINGKSPDFISEELKTVVLAHGIYWHLGIYSLEVTEENKKKVENIDSLPFINAGYKVIFIWEGQVK